MSNMIYIETLEDGMAPIGLQRDPPWVSVEPGLAGWWIRPCLNLSKYMCLTQLNYDYLKKEKKESMEK